MFERPPPSAGEVRALAHQLLSWADHLRVRSEPNRPMTEQDRHDMLLGLAEAIRGARRHRARIFADIPLGTPLWDVMLDLFIRDLNGYRTPLEQQLAGGEFSPDTLERSLRTLNGLGIVTMIVDRLDQKKIWIALSERGRQGMFELLQESAELFGLHPRTSAETAEAI